MHPRARRILASLAMLGLVVTSSGLVGLTVCHGSEHAALEVQIAGRCRPAGSETPHPQPCESPPGRPEEDQAVRGDCTDLLLHTTAGAIVPSTPDSPGAVVYMAHPPAPWPAPPAGGRGDLLCSASSLSLIRSVVFLI